MKAPPGLLPAVLACQGKREGDEYRFRCPAHDDEHPSARYNSEKEVWHCDACKSGGGYVDLCKRLGVPLPEDRSSQGQTTYDYRDAAGELAFQVVRTSSKGFRQRRPDGQGGWLWNLKGVDRVLYRLPSVLAAVKDGKSIWIAEGEKDADNLVALGLPATTNSGGAGKWQKSYGATLRGARIAILPDNDKAGREHAQKVATALHGVAAEIKILELPDLPEKGDVSDWINAQRKSGKTQGEIREALEKLAELATNAEEWLEGDSPADRQRQSRDVDQRASQVQALTEIASEVQLSHSPDGIAFASIRIGDHIETWPIRSRSFSAWLVRSFFEREGDHPPPSLCPA